MIMTEWLIGLGGLIVTILIFSYTQWQRKRVDSAQLTLNLTQRLYEPKIEKIRAKISFAITAKQTIKIQNETEMMELTITEDEINEYLNELEQIGLFLNQGVLGKEFAYQMFGYQFVSVWEYKPIVEYIKEERKVTQKDLWDQFEKAYKKFKKEQKKRKVIPMFRYFKETYNKLKQSKLDD
jgi:hypothetical protein